MDKKRIVKDYDNLPEEILNQVKLKYPNGFANNLVSYLNKEGQKVSALPFETDDIYYLIRMTVQEARQIIEDDDDYDDDGKLRDDFGSDDDFADVADTDDEEEDSYDQPDVSDGDDDDVD